MFEIPVDPALNLVDQTIFVGNPEGKRGNCWQAALATVLGLPLEAVPNFVQDDVDTGRYYLDLTQEWLEPRGWQIGPLLPGSEPEPHELLLAWGDSPRRVLHVCVYQDGELFHDPHPSRDGLTHVTGYWTVRPIAAFVAPTETYPRELSPCTSPGTAQGSAPSLLSLIEPCQENQ